MPSKYKIFFIENTKTSGQWLRRYSVDSGGACPLMPGKYSYHDIMLRIEDSPDPSSAGDDRWPRTDPRWPKNCKCGFQFRDEDNWQLFRLTLYRAADGRLLTIHSNPDCIPAPPGAAWYMDDWPEWEHRKKGPDGHSIMIMTPAGSWSPDEPSWGPGGAGAGWTRTGTVPDTLDVKPSIRIGDPTRYHGHVNVGYLEACGDSPT